MSFPPMLARMCAPVILGAALLCPLASGQDSTAPAPKPDFSGRWRMIKDQSDFGTFNKPDIIVRVIDQHDPTLNVHTVQTSDKKTSVSDISYFLDGSPSKNVINGRDAESKTFWDGSVLVVRTNMKDSKGEDELIVDRWELSDDRNTLTVSSHVEVGSGEADLKLVCSRETPGN